ncbi:hypothetical protein ABPG73_002778 [Tetrahymena malaccensis]
MENYFFNIPNNKSSLDSKDFSKEDIKENQIKESSQSDENKLAQNTISQLSQKNFDFNQNQEQKSYSNVIKEQKNKLLDITNQESSLEVKHLSKEDIKQIQKNEIPQSDENEQAKNKLSNQISQMTKENSYKIINQENLSNMKKGEEAQDDSDLTLKKKIKIQLNRNLANNQLLQKVTLQVFNTKEEQNVIINYMSQENEVQLQCLSTKFNQQEISKQKKSDDYNSQNITIRKSKQNIPEIMKLQGYPISYDSQKQQHQYIVNQIKENNNNLNDYLIPAEQDEIKSENIDNIALQDNFSYKLNQNMQKSIKCDYQSDDSIQNMNISNNQFDQAQLEPLVQQEAQNKINPQIEKQLTEICASEIIKLINQIKEILVSHDKLTLVLGYQKYSDSELTDQTNKEIISFIYHNPTEQEQFCLNQIFITQQIKFDHIKIDQDNIQIFTFSKSDFEALISYIFKLTQFESIYQIKDYYEMNSTNFPLNCTECENQNICKNYKCFQNIKARIIAFLKFKNQFYCEYQDKLIKGLIFQFSQDKLITFYTKFVFKLIFSFLENEEANQQNIQNEIKFK